MDIQSSTDYRICWTQPYILNPIQYHASSVKVGRPSGWCWCSEQEGQRCITYDLRCWHIAPPFEHITEYWIPRTSDFWWLIELGDSIMTTIIWSIWFSWCELWRGMSWVRFYFCHLCTVHVNHKQYQTISKHHFGPIPYIIQLSPCAIICYVKWVLTVYYILCIFNGCFEISFDLHHVCVHWNHW